MHRGEEISCVATPLAREEFASELFVLYLNGTIRDVCKMGREVTKLYLYTRIKKCVCKCARRKLYYEYNRFVQQAIAQALTPIYEYVLRPLLSAKWILDKRSAPPMLFEELVEAELEDELKAEVERLLEMKKSLPERGMAPKIESLNDYIERVMPEIKMIAEGMEDSVSEWRRLNELFLRVVK